MVELPDAGVAADRAPVDQDLGHGPAAGEVGPPPVIVRKISSNSIPRDSSRVLARTCGRSRPRGGLGEQLERGMARPLLHHRGGGAALDSAREADRVLHLYTLDRGRVGAVAKGVRTTKSRFGARLEPLEPRRAAAPPGKRRPADRHWCVWLQLGHREPASSRTASTSGSSAGGDAAPVPRTGGEQARVRALARFLELLDEVEPADAKPQVDPPRALLPLIRYLPPP